jgi:hypothetical protein
MRDRGCLPARSAVEWSTILAKTGLSLSSGAVQ